MHYKQNNKESKTYVQGLRPFVNTLPRGIKGILKKNGYNYSEIVGKWKSLVGKDISDFTYPKSIKISKSQKNGILVLRVKRGNEITIEYSKKEIIEKINSFFGYKLIGQIKLETINSETKKINSKGRIKKFSYDFEKKIKEIKNKEIRKSLSNLLNSMKNA
tara:strand:- start:1226 stop:1708 length:483 start_codon:yes stop_codon:yes gene_type:complete